jgi:hypothetical protein
MTVSLQELEDSSFLRSFSILPKSLTSEDIILSFLTHFTVIKDFELGWLYRQRYSEVPLTSYSTKSQIQGMEAPSHFGNHSCT